MKKDEKRILEKYYISEAFDENRNISFNFKKANKKISGNFAEFIDAVEEFIKISEKSYHDTRVWFHRDGAYRGSVGIDKARLIVERIREKSIKNQDAITYIERENLVEKSTNFAKQEEVNLKDEARKVTFLVMGVESKRASQVELKDIRPNSIYDVVIDEIAPSKNDRELYVYYHITANDKSSPKIMYTIKGFASAKVGACSISNPCNSKHCPRCSTNLSYAKDTGLSKATFLSLVSTKWDASNSLSIINEQEEVVQEEAAVPVEQPKRSTGFWFLISVLWLLIFVNIILIILRVTGTL
ncbi:hypothetical protein HGG64_02515 [Mycoplasma phocoeninasale]|uniref:Uncharacterized protein n=1 Tax=Mycoplasma phocoeninasale TaxID=2726117 RepID=A0A858U5N7_9MOLU|nr:hypothetical protein [Mycoplasma phocoeninasale]QJG66563.1 hypothetical protein HGG64_02515 [Mycoplasma phocoeninasale]